MLQNECMTKKIKYLLGVLFLSMLPYSAHTMREAYEVPTTSAAASESNGFFSRVSHGLSRPADFITNNVAFFAMFRPLLRVPEILTMDSDNATVVMTGSALSTLATDAKIAFELQEEHMLIQSILWHQPKVLGYLISAIYDVIRMLKSEEVAFKNRTQPEPDKMRNIKTNQLIKIGIETCLRVLTFVISLHADTNSSDTSLAVYTAEIADMVELWNLLSRISQDDLPFSKIDAHFNVTLNESASTALADDEEPIDLLAEEEEPVLFTA
jgi:hypothetical protein